MSNTHPAIDRIFGTQSEKYPTTESKLDYARACKADCDEQGWKGASACWTETIAALESVKAEEGMQIGSA